MKTVALGRLFGGWWLAAAWVPVTVMALAVLVAVPGVMATSRPSMFSSPRRSALPGR